MQKRVVAVHDISCIGRCSLTVALPILSAAGIETSVLPTAVLSTHTGGFENYTFRDLSEDIMPILRHWKSLAIHTDAVYTGYLGSIAQIDMMQALLSSEITRGAFRVVDPVMGDNGKMYASFTSDFAVKMRALCQNADMILPNLTEAALLLGEPYREEYDRTYIEETLVKLSALGPREVVLSGVSLEQGKIGAASYDRETGTFEYYFTDRVKGMFHGTGDVFGSALLAALLTEKPLGAAVRVAVDYTLGAILRTEKEKTDIRFGVNFEEGIPELLHALGKM